ncbi:putative l-lactate dehydrogenase [Achaetomium macrosporum]|uniref:L-lactate dehydrogenase n=1 Tax=Achaetomium macrosporum TaxID=79813 RepID=A0AAN7C020_9PEZI|nr:putative l-lactate dehydrogenase [Achaetomium macrosporum]
MDPKGPSKDKRSTRTTPQYAMCQRENSGRATTGSSNAGQSHTHTANRQAFYRYRVVPRMLVDTNVRDTATLFFGRHKVAAPIGFAPVGINKIYHPRGELAVAQVAGELNLPYCLSTACSQPIEKVAEANGENGVRFFQLYMPHDDKLTVSLLKRAVASGFEGCF